MRERIRRKSSGPYPPSAAGRPLSGAVTAVAGCVAVRVGTGMGTRDMVIVGGALRLRKLRRRQRPAGGSGVLLLLLLLLPCSRFSGCRRGGGTSLTKITAPPRKRPAAGDGVEVCVRARIASAHTNSPSRQLILTRGSRPSPFDGSRISMRGVCHGHGRRAAFPEHGRGRSLPAPCARGAAVQARGARPAHSKCAWASTADSPPSSAG